MKVKLLPIILLSSFALFADNFRNELIIPGVNINNPFWEFSYQSIAQKEEGLFAELVTKWNKNIDRIWTNLNSKVKGDINVSAQEIQYYLNEKNFVDAYTNYCKHLYGECMTEELSQEIDPNVLNFIQLKLSYLKLKKPVKIYEKHDTSLLTASFGTDKTHYSLILNGNVYTPEKVIELYESTKTKESLYHIESHTNLHRSQVIETSNLLHLGIAQATSNIFHQNDFFAKLLGILLYNKKHISKETQIYGTDYVQFQSYLEACLQSKNPLEIALFLEAKLTNLNQEFILLWRELIQDIRDCYDPEDLRAYETVSLQMRRAALYNNNE